MTPYFGPYLALYFLSSARSLAPLCKAAKIEKRKGKERRHML
jgi:hypothetical protein